MKQCEDRSENVCIDVTETICEVSDDNDVSDGKDDSKANEDDFVHADPMQTNDSSPGSGVPIPLQFIRFLIGPLLKMSAPHWLIQTCHQTQKTVTKVICQVTETFYSAGNNMVKPKRHKT